VLASGNSLIQQEIMKITDPKIRQKTEERLEEIRNGKRDLYF
jgi:DNA topoisomerase IA